MTKKFSKNPYSHISNTLRNSHNLKLTPSYYIKKKHNSLYLSKKSPLSISCEPWIDLNTSHINFNSFICKCEYIAGEKCKEKPQTCLLEPGGLSSKMKFLLNAQWWEINFEKCQDVICDKGGSCGVNLPLHGCRVVFICLPFEWFFFSSSRCFVISRWDVSCTAILKKFVK